MMDYSLAKNPSCTHFLSEVQRTVQDQPVETVPVPLLTSTSQTDNSIERCRSYHSVVEHTAHSKAPQSPQQVETTSALSVQDTSVC